MRYVIPKKTRKELINQLVYKKQMVNAKTEFNGKDVWFAGYGNDNIPVYFEVFENDDNLWELKKINKKDDL